MSDLIEGYGAVCKYLGHNTRFHDDEIIRIEVDRGGPTVVGRVFVAPVSRESTKHDIIMMTFEDVSGFSLNDFNHQNVIQELNVTELDGYLNVRLFSLFGAEIALTYRSSKMQLVTRE